MSPGGKLGTTSRNLSSMDSIVYSFTPHRNGIGRSRKYICSEQWLGRLVKNVCMIGVHLYDSGGLFRGSEHRYKAANDT